MLGCLACVIPARRSSEQLKACSQREPSGKLACGPGNVRGRDYLHLTGDLFVPLPSASVDRNQREKYTFFFLHLEWCSYRGLMACNLVPFSCKVKSKWILDFEQKLFSNSTLYEILTSAGFCKILRFVFKLKKKTNQNPSNPLLSC